MDSLNPNKIVCALIIASDEALESARTCFVNFWNKRKDLALSDASIDFENFVLPILKENIPKEFLKDLFEQVDWMEVVELLSGSGCV